MNTIKLHFFTFLFFIFYNISSLFAQNSNADTSLYHLAVQNVISLYTKTLEENTHLYNGMEYIESHPDVSGTPFWRTDTLQEGSIYYDGIFYPNIFLAYDAVKEEVAIKNQQRLSIKLLTEKINSFTLSNQLFVNITSDSANN